MSRKIEVRRSAASAWVNLGLEYGFWELFFFAQLSTEKCILQSYMGLQLVLFLYNWKLKKVTSPIIFAICIPLILNVCV